jgi:hypothetical protein
MTQIAVGLGEVRLEAKGRAELGLRLLGPALRVQGVAEVVAGLGEVWLEAKGRAVLGLRLL